MILTLALAHVAVVLSVELASGGDLFLASGYLERHRTRQRARPVLKRHARVAQVWVLERDDFET